MRGSSGFLAGHGVNFVCAGRGSGGTGTRGGWAGFIEKLFQAKAPLRGELIRRARGQAQVGSRLSKLA